MKDSLPNFLKMTLGLHVAPGSTAPAIDFDAVELTQWLGRDVPMIQESPPCQMFSGTNPRPPVHVTEDVISWGWDANGSPVLE